MSSLLGHLDNSYSDGEEDDHINRLFPKCKPRASSLQPFTTATVTTTSTATPTNDEIKLFHESRASVSDCNNLTNSNNNINTVNNNFPRKHHHHHQQQHHHQHHHHHQKHQENYQESRDNVVIENGQIKDYNNFSFRCSNVSTASTAGNSRKLSGGSENSTKLSKSKKGDYYRNSRHRYNIEFVPTGESPVSGRPQLLSSSSSSPVGINQVHNNSGVSTFKTSMTTRKSTSYDKIMECDTLDDNFDNGIESSGSGSTGSNGSAFSQCSSLGGSGGGDKNNALSISNNTGGGGNNVGLRDSRIEIAGGREIYSQNRIKAIRKSKQASDLAASATTTTAGLNLTSTTSSQSQLQAKIRRKSSQNNTTNPLLSPSSPVSTCNNSVWEPHHLVGANKKSFPFSSSSSSSSRGGDVERDTITTSSSNRGGGGGATFMGSSANSMTMSSSSRHGGQSGGGGGHSYLQSSRSSHSQSRNFGRHGGGGGGYDYSDARKTLSLDGFDMMGGNKSMLPQLHSAAALSNILTSPSSSTSSGLMMKETVFASEITSIEKPVEVASGGDKDVKQPFIYETPIDGGGEIVFDDIEDQWGRRRSKEDDKEATFVSMGTVDKSQLNFLETLMRDNDEQQQQLQQHHHHNQQQQLQQHHHHQQQQQVQPRKVSSNPSGYESDECASSPVSASNSKTSPNNGNKRLIESIPIAEYEGSPKRYGLRLPTQAKPNHLELVDPNSPTIAHLSVSTRVVSPRIQSPSSSFQGGGGGRVPGFPQRVDTSNVLPPASSTTSSTLPTSSNNSIIKTILVNDSSNSSEAPSSSSVTMLTERNHDHRSEPDGQLNAKLDRIMSTTTGTVPVMSTDMSMSAMGTGTITRTMTTGTTDTSPDDSLASQQGSNNTTTNSSEDPELEVSSHRPDLKEDRDDYLLYEFSETRKVLEEFFKPSPTTMTTTGEDGRLTNFDELDYTLKRQAGNSYVGQRLAGESSNEQVEESPKKPPRRGVLLNVSSGGGASPKLISFQEVSLPPLSHNSHSQSSISPSSMMMGAPAMLLDSSRDVNDNDVDVETASTNTETDLGDTEVGLQVGHSRNFTLSPETTDCDSNELESEISLDYDASLHSSSRLGATMPVLEDGLSSGNVSDNEDRDDDEGRKRTGLSLNSCIKNSTGQLVPNNNPLEPNPTLLLMKKQISEIEKEIKLRSQRVHPTDSTNGGNVGSSSNNGVTNGTGPSPSQSNQSHQGIILPLSNNKGKHQMDINSTEDNFAVRDNSRPESNIFDCNDPELEALDPMRPTPPPSPAPSSVPHHHHLHNNSLHHHHLSSQQVSQPQLLTSRMVSFSSSRCSSGEVISSETNTTPHNSSSNSHCGDPNSTNNNNGLVPATASSSSSSTMMMTTTTAAAGASSGTNTNSSLGLLHDSTSTILSSDPSAGVGLSSSTAAVVGSDIQGTKDAIQLPKSFPSLRSSFDSPSTTSVSAVPGTTPPTTTTTNLTLACSSSQQLPPQQSSDEERLAPLVRDSSPVWVPRHPASGSHPHRSAGVRDPLLRKQRYEETPDDDADTDQETDRLLGQNRTEDDYGFYDEKDGAKKKRSKEDLMNNPSVLIEGVLFRARYLGSTQLVCEGQPTKATRMMQAEEAVSRIKAPEGETQPSTEVDLFISTEKIMVLNTDLKEIMMDHALRTISYIADIGDLVVLMARRRPVPTDTVDESKIPRPPKMICHVFESDEAQYIAQSIGQAFQVAYMEFLKANGIEDHSFVREMDYQEVLNSQEIFGDELQMFAKKELQKEVVVPKTKGEILGVVIVESGWGSMLPTVVIANLAPAGAAARCGQLNIGDQIIAINGVSLVGLPLSTCQNYIKNAKAQTVVKLTVVPCPPVVEVKIKRPDTKYQLGFSVQNGVICSLLRGGIAERGGVRVGHRIIEINNQSVVAVPHEKIVNLLATSVGEINMKTMPTSMFRLLTGQESPLYI